MAGSLNKAGRRYGIWPSSRWNMPLWSEKWVAVPSEFGVTSTASSAIMALECALALQLEHKHFVTAPKTNDRKLTTILKVAAMYKSTVPPDTASVMVEVGRYRDHLFIERSHHFVLPQWSELTVFAVECGRLFQSNVIIRKTDDNRLIVKDLDFTQTGLTSNFIDRYQRLMQNTYSNPYSVAQNRRAAYEIRKNDLFRDYELMDQDPIIASALDIYSDESTVDNIEGEILKIRTEVI